MDWFERGHDSTAGWVKNSDGFWRTQIESGMYVLAPPQTAADAALEELRVSGVTRQTSTPHVRLVPRLMTPDWLKQQLYKASDIVFSVPVGKSFWQKDMH
jgi:hypothetical protein